MKVEVIDRHFDDLSRGVRNVKAWEVSIVLEGVPIFTRPYQAIIPYSSGYADKGDRVADKAAAKKQIVHDFRKFLEKRVSH